ncbi:MAG TPA: LuxR C-terminal-related transcriptional regulator [Nannocystis sp.]
MKISMLDTQMTTSMEARNSAGTWQKTAAADVEPATARPVPVVNLLTELLQGYRRPAVVSTEQGTIVCMNAAAMRSIDRKPGDEDDGIPADPKEWPRRASIQAEGQTFYLSVPNQALDTASGAPEPQLPPRLAKIARLVISGCTDKQIATRTGLSFSTVRTYVRQIYRRIGVHSRVELVHASNTSLARD